MKKYELSMTRDYVSSWGVIEAIRELIQNSHDSSGTEKIEIDERNGTITISNKGVSISPSTLALGATTKKEDLDTVGCYGEGYKLATLVLLREGYDITIYNGNRIWVPSFEYSDLFETEVLCFTETEANGSDLTFEISGMPEYTLEGIKEEFLGLEDNNYSSIPTMYGEIITDAKYKGKMFVNGLPIYTDDKFIYGYNFKTQYIELDRDRKSINLRELKKITSLSIVYMENPDYNMVDGLIENGRGEDAEYIKDRYVSMPENFVDEYAKHLKSRFNIDDNTVVVQKTEEKLLDEIAKKQKTEDIKLVIMPNKTFADVINRRSSYSSNFLNDLHNEMSHRSEIDNAWDNYNCSDYKDFKEWFDKYGNCLDNDATDKFNDILSNIEPTDFYLIKDEV